LFLLIGNVKIIILFILLILFYQRNILNALFISFFFTPQSATLTLPSRCLSLGFSYSGMLPKRNWRWSIQCMLKKYRFRPWRRLMGRLIVSWDWGRGLRWRWRCWSWSSSRIMGMWGLRRKMIRKRTSSK